MYPARFDIRKLGLAALLSAIWFMPLSLAQTQNESAGWQVDPGLLAKQVVQNELNAQTRDRSQWKFREVQIQHGRRELLEVVDTPSGQIHRLLAVDGKALSRKQQANEDERIRRLLADQDRWRKQQTSRRADASQARKLLEMLPAAFRYQYAGREGDLVKLRFVPNPAFHAQGHEAEVFHDMAGFMLVEPKQKRLAEIDGRLLCEVRFAGGLLGHLNAGGTFSVKQANVGQGHWEMTLLEVNMDGKALFFKTIAVHEKEMYSHYRPVPDGLTLEQAAEILHRDTVS
jgi:hypothetical protein